VPFASIGPRPFDEMLEEPDEGIIITKVLVAFEGTAGSVEPLRYVHVSKDDEALSFARAHARAAHPRTAGQTRINPTLSRP
jgi:hypothetical protein